MIGQSLVIIVNCVTSLHIEIVIMFLFFQMWTNVLVTLALMVHAQMDETSLHAHARLDIPEPHAVKVLSHSLKVINAVYILLKLCFQKNF